MWEKREINTEFWWGYLGKTYFQGQEGEGREHNDGSGFKMEDGDETS
jgi:hypothetical protein